MKASLDKLKQQLQGNGHPEGLGVSVRSASPSRVQN